jgi:hypothetical protein
VLKLRRRHFLEYLYQSPFPSAFCLFLAFLSFVHSAAAACEPYRSDPAFLADLQKDDFIARVFPHAPPQSAELPQKLRALALTNSPDQIGELAQIEGMWRMVTGAPFPFPLTMSVPYDLVFTGGRYPMSDPIKIEFDADGDGKPELVHEFNNMGETVSYTYARQGNYEPLLRIYDRSGAIRTHKIHLRLLSPQAFDAHLQAVWNDLREALRRGDMTAALDCIHSQSRKRYKQTFEAIPDLSKKVDEILGPIRFVKNRKEDVIYEMLRKKPDGTYSYDIRMIADYDTVWRIRSF